MDTDPALRVFFFVSRRRYRAACRERSSLLQEKAAVLRFVQNVGEVFAAAETVEMDQLLERVLQYAVLTCKAGSGAIYLTDASQKKMAIRALSGIFPPLFKVAADALETGPEASSKIETLLRNRTLSMGEGLIGETAEQDRAILIEDAERDERVPQLPIDLLRIHTLLLVPMRFGNRVIGVMVLVNRINSSRFALSDLNLAQALAAQAAVPIHYAGLQETLEQKRQIDRDMQIARQIQHSLLPQKLPSHSSVELAAFSHPALDIGGDYYDCIHIDEKRIGLVIADVSGKGIGGALMMAVCRGLLQANAVAEPDPARILGALNQALSTNLADDMFISMLYMVLNLETHQLRYARAGHEAFILLRKGKLHTERDESAGVAIGLVDQATFSGIIETHSVSLLPGDLVLAYTDGITEAMNKKGDEWGVAQLLQATESRIDLSAANLLEAIQADVLKFSGNTPQYDDMTMLAIKIR